MINTSNEINIITPFNIFGIIAMIFIALCGIIGGICVIIQEVKFRHKMSKLQEYWSEINNGN